MSGLNELNQRLHEIGIGVRLDAAAAEALKAVATRERILSAVSRVETHKDRGAYTFLQKSFEQAGIGPNGQSTQQQPAQRQPQQVNQQPRQQQPTQAPSQPQQNRPAQQQRPNTPAQQSNTQRQPQQHNAGQPQTQQRNGERKTGQTSRDDWIQHHIYGTKAAVMFGLTTTRKDVPTVYLDAALAKGVRQYDWSKENKVRLQVTQSELPVVAATLLGIMPSCTFKNHGEQGNNNKGFAIDWQGERSSFFVQVWQGQGNARAVPMTREDAFYAAQIVIRAIQEGSPARMDVTGLLATLRAMYGR